MQRRILITQWVEKKRFVEKTKCLMTPDGSHDKKNLNLGACQILK